ncbi:sporulation protein [Bacillus smithii]|uniref:sporulation protein n=1 Tax=Bacillus smithii TaxID=1479 RepID=UPI002E1CB8C2|nr:sporulation protein [Bacillus smithii]
MFKKILASFGKGSATVDLRLYTNSYQVGENVQGDVVIFGGEVDQKIRSIDVGLFMEIRNEHGMAKHHIATVPASGPFIIHAHEEKYIPFHYQLPFTLPVSCPTVSFYFDTYLDIEGGADKKDVDYVEIRPIPPIMNVFEALERLGFRQTSTSGKLDRFGQEFSFFPMSHFAQDIHEIEMRLALEEQGIRVWMEVEVRQGYHEVEVKREFFLTQEVLNDMSALVNVLERYIVEAIQQPGFYHQPHSYHTYSYEPYDYDEHPFRQHGNSAAGMIGGFVAGALGGMLLDEVMEDLIHEDHDHDHEYDHDGFGFDDFFGDDV